MAYQAKLPLDLVAMSTPLPGGTRILLIDAATNTIKHASKDEIIAELGIDFDVQVDQLADRDAYDSEAEGFRVLVSDTGDGRAAIYSRNSATPGTWSAPAYLSDSNGAVRQVLTANRTYYVRGDGSDSNTGLADDAAGAFLTIQKAIDTVASIDLSIYDATIQVSDGTWSQTLTMRTVIGAGRAILRGNTATPASVLLQVASNPIFVFNAVAGRWHLEGMRLVTTTSGHQIEVAALCPGLLLTYGNMDFGPSGNFHFVNEGGAKIKATANYTISGGAQYHAWCTYAGSSFDNSGVTVTVTGTPAFSGAFFRAGYNATIIGYGVTYVGSATGIRYDVLANGVIFTQGGPTYLPGNADGASATGGQYL